MRRITTKPVPGKLTLKVKLLALLFFAVLVITALGLTLGPKHLGTVTSQELTTVRVPVDIWPGNFWFVVADAKGFFKEEGLKAELIDVTADYGQSFEDFINKDTLDVMIPSVFDLVDRNIEGADLVAVLVTDNSEGAEGLIAKKEFAKLADLKGKRIGVEVGSYLEFLLDVAMSNVGINPDEYTKVDLVTDDIFDVFEKEHLDAAFMWEPTLSETSAKYNLQKIFDTSDIRGLSPGVLALKRQFIEDNPETVQALVRVWDKATDYILAHKEETYRLISQIDFEDKPGESYYSYDEVEALAKQDVILSLEDNMKVFSFDSGFVSIYGNLQFVSRFLQSSRGLDSTPNTNRMFTDQFIRNINR
jgi:NitT/TauT family transport system substrate-binding protein